MLKQPMSCPSFLEPLEPRRLLSAGDVDTSFGNAGRVIHGIPGDLSPLAPTLFLPDGKILFAGTAFFPRVGERDYYYLRRYHADGSLDATFGQEGTITGNFTATPNENTEITHIAAGPDGKIWAVGRGGPGGETHVLARFNANGSPDETFGGGDGSVVIADRSFGVQIQSDGKPVVLGDNGVTRYRADGAIDTTFGGGDGNAPSPIGRVTQVLRLGPDGKILLGGSAAGDAGVLRFAVARLTADGGVDASFGGGDGLVVTAVAGTGTESNSVGDIAVLPGGKMLVAGNNGPVGSPVGGVTVVRYNGDGSVDESYADDGAALVSFGSGVAVDRLLVDADGNAIVVGGTLYGAAIARLTPTGTVDETFGRVITYGSGSTEEFIEPGFFQSSSVSGAGIGPDGKLIVTGQRRPVTRDLKQHHQNFLVRFHTEDDGAPSPVTLAGGTLSITGTAGADLIEADEVGNTVYAHRRGYGRAFDTADVQRVAITGADGNDVLSATELLTVPASVVGGLGVDKIAGGADDDTLEGSGGPDFIDAGDGDDLVNGGGGNDGIRGQGGDDTLHGADGDDELRGNAGADVYVGGPGDDVEIDIDDPHVSLQDGVLRFADPLNDNDVVSIFPDGAGGLTIFVDGQTDTLPMNLVSFIELNGNGGHDYLKVHPLLSIRAVIYGGIGPQTDRAGGNDTLIGGALNDTLIGHGGDDFLFASGGNDHLQGGLGSDVLRGHAGFDTADYTDHINTVIITVDAAADDGEAGESDLVFTDLERVLGTLDHDRISAGAGRQILFGGDGNDTLDAGAGDDAIYGAGGNDHLEAGDGDDYVEGGAGDDVLAGGPGADRLFGLAGNDRFFADDGTRDTVRGGPGDDTADADALDDVIGAEVVLR